MSKKITVVVCRVGQRPVVEEIEAGLDGMQAIVGGYIEMVRVSDTVDMWLNEEGRINGSTLNRLVRDDYRQDWDIHGDFFFASHNDEGETVSLSPSDVKKWMARASDAPVNIFAIPE